MHSTHREQPYDVVSLASAPTPDNQQEAVPPGSALTPGRINVHRIERVASTLVGGYLLARWKLKSRQSNKLLALVGSSLLYRGLSGHCHLYQALGISTVKPQEHDQLTSAS